MVSVIFVYAETMHDAITWCRANDVRPLARDTRIVTRRSPHGGRGCKLTTDDRVVVLGRSIEEQVRAVLGPAGLGTIVMPEFPDYPERQEAP